MDINTGALSINLICLSTISSQPVLIEKRGERVIFEVKASETCLYLAAEGLVESVSYPGVDHLFMLLSEGLAETYFILRELDGTGSYKLIASCTELFLLELVSPESPNILSSTYTTLQVDCLYRRIERLRTWIDWDLLAPYRACSGTNLFPLEGFFPGIKKFRDFMPAYRRWLSGVVVFI